MSKIIQITLLLFIASLARINAQCTRENPENLLSSKTYGKIKKLTYYRCYTTYSFGAATEKREQYSYETRQFDQEGKLNNVEIFDYYGIKCKYVFSYDSLQNLISEKSYDANSQLQLTIFRKYDDRHNILEENTYEFEEGRFYSKFQYKYDVNNSLIERISYSSSNTVNSQYKFEYKYDSEKKVIEKYKPKTNYDRIFFKYDNDGNLIEKIIYNYYDPKESDHFFEDKFTWKYDAKGNVIEETKYFSNGSIEYKKGYVFQYDNTGNWIKYIYSENDIQKYSIEREIEYY